MPSHSAPKEPAFTVLCNIVSTGSNWIGTSWEFFDDKVMAELRYDALVMSGQCPTLRPFYGLTDWPHLGAIHQYWKSVKGD